MSTYIAPAICLKAAHRHPNYSHARACLEWKPSNHVPQLVESLEAAPAAYEMFTFGSAHLHPVTGQYLANRCVVWAGRAEVPRALQFQRFGSFWAFHYGPERAPKVIAEHGLRLLTGDEIPPIRLQDSDDLQQWVDTILG